MPPRPTHRLDVILVPVSDSKAAAETAIQGLLDSWRDAGWLLGEHPTASAPFACKRIRVDRPATRTLYANGIGGFKVFCPRCETAIPARAFSHSGATCASCDTHTPVTGLDCRPPVALGHAALVLVEAEHSEVPIPPGFSRVWRRR